MVVGDRNKALFLAAYFAKRRKQLWSELAPCFCQTSLLIILNGRNSILCCDTDNTICMKKSFDILYLYSDIVSNTSVGRGMVSASFFTHLPFALTIGIPFGFINHRYSRRVLDT